MAFLAILFVLAGLVLFAFGRRGWAVGHHPFCRLCGFNLHALPMDHQRCPECGANILLPDAIHVGHRKPIYSFMTLGAIFGFAGGVLLAPPVLDWWSIFDGSPYKPVSWLQAEINAPNETDRTRACAELRHRLQTGAISPSAVDHLAEVVLKLQADPVIAWKPHWGDLVQFGHQSRRLSNALWQQYLAQSMQISAHVRPRVRIDDPVPISLVCQMRAGNDFSQIIPATLSPKITATLGTLTGPVRARTIQLDSIPIPIEWSALWMPATREGASRTDWSIDSGGLSTGPQNLQLSITMSLSDSERTTASAAFTLTLPLQLLARTESSVALRQPTSMNADMQQAIRLRRPAGFVGNPSEPLPITSTGGALGNLWISGPPTGAAFRVVLRQEGHDWSLARFLVRPNDAATIPLKLEISPLDQGPHSGDAEIVCLPEPSLALGTVDTLEVWGGEIHRPLILSVINH